MAVPFRILEFLASLRLPNLPRFKSIKEHSLLWESTTELENLEIDPSSKEYALGVAAKEFMIFPVSNLPLKQCIVESSYRCFPINSGYPNFQSIYSQQILDLT
uniref:Uncharacterized protein n=1 Tax=Rhizophora mucronata TaxID=61149 RepID=A0A2P2QRN6_RHIMU